MANQIPEIIDPVKFARQGESIYGQIDLMMFPRLLTSLMELRVELQVEHQDGANTSTKATVENTGSVRFELDFSLKGRAYVASGSYKTEVTMVCQRCLETMQVPISENIHLEFVILDSISDSKGNKEEGIAKSSLDGSDYDLVTLTSETIRLQDLIEDEVLLGLPFSPMHEEKECPAAHQIKELQNKDTQDQDRPNPFAVLADFAKLKKDQES